MDTFTHALSGALVARVAVKPGAQHPSAGECAVLGALAAAFPDSDIVLSYLSPLAYLHHHRGVTHSVLLLPVWALLLAWLWSVLRGNRPGFRIYALICALGLGMHILGDLITSFGTMIFAPLSSTRVEWGTTFIIDLWLTGIIVAALVGAWIWRSSRIPGLIGIAVVLGYIGLQWQLGRQATEIGIAYVHAQAIPAARVRALPRPVSPFNWMIIVTEPDRYHYANVNLRRKQPLAQGPEAGFVRRLDMHYLPIERLRWQTLPKFGDGAARAFSEEAWRQDEFAFYRWFAAYPLVAEVSRENGADCVWFRDLRFLTPGRESWPFRYGMCREPGGAWHAYSYPEGGSALRVR